MRLHELQPNVTTYSVVIRTYVKGEMSVRALLLFIVQLQGLEPKWVRARYSSLQESDLAALR